MKGLGANGIQRSTNISRRVVSGHDDRDLRMKRTHEGRNSEPRLGTESLELNRSVFEGNGADLDRIDLGVLSLVNEADFDISRSRGRRRFQDQRAETAACFGK